MSVRVFIATFIGLLSTGVLWDVPVNGAEILSDNSSISEGVGALDEFASYAVEASAASETCPCGCEDQDGKECCTCKKQKELEKKAGAAYKTLFFDNDFNYLCDPCYDNWHLGEELKRLCAGCDGNLDIGGQVRFRYQHEEGMKGFRFANNTDDFLLARLRMYANYQMNDFLRFYVEGIYADSYGESFPPRAIDVNNGDFLNLFVDANLTYDTVLRVGRQELLYGAQRTVSPLDWANTRRTFEGVKILHQTGDWSIDAFFTNQVIVDPFELDEAAYNQPFYGAYAVYKGFSDATLDLYYLGYDNQVRAFSLHTFGARLNGHRGDLLYELEGAYQGGDAAGVGTGDQSEGFVTAGLGRKLMPCHSWKPTLWVYFDYASRNYNQLFPLAHEYLGFIDAVQRSNIISPNVLLTAKPTDKLSLLAWYYHFESATGAPVPSIGGTPPQNAGRNFGDELDLLAKYKINARNDVLIGYSHFWKGSKITNPNDADFAYLQWTTNF